MNYVCSATRAQEQTRHCAGEDTLSRTLLTWEDPAAENHLLRPILVKRAASCHSQKLTVSAATRKYLAKLHRDPWTRTESGQELGKQSACFDIGANVECTLAASASVTWIQRDKNKRAYRKMSGAERLCTSGPTTMTFGRDSRKHMRCTTACVLKEDAAILNATTSQAPSGMR